MIDFCSLKLKSNIFLAPMAGITDLAFRSICREFGASLCYSEMISAKALCYNDKKTFTLLKTNEKDSPLAVQIFGSEPEIMAKGAAIVEKNGFPLIDINSGCPAPKIFNNGEGSALMKNPDLIYEIVKAVTAAVDVPVTVKIRRGVDEGCENALECALAAEAAGASAVTVHGRFREQYYSGVSDYSIIKKVREALSIPVVANGDVTSPEEAFSLMEKTGCGFVMIGRGALGRPYIFKQTEDYRNTGTYEEYSTEFTLNTMLKQITLACEYKGEIPAIKEARKHILWYLKGFRNAKSLRNEATRVNTLDEVRSFIENLNKFENL